jgi:hypothetical protein
LTPNVESPHNGGAPDNGEDIRAAFDAVFQRSPGISDKDIGPLSEHYRKWNLISKGDVERALSAMAAAILKIEANYLDIVQLNDLDRLYQAPFFLADSKRAARRIGLLLEKRAQQKQRNEEFRTTYAPGEELLGTVVYVAPDYALVQLPRGDTGIVHVKAVKSSRSEFVGLRRRLKAGATVRVRVLVSDYRSRRIDLNLVSI